MAPAVGYNEAVAEMRGQEYPSLKSTTYLDHAGTTLCSKSLMENFASRMTNDLLGNPHSSSQSSQRSARLVDDVRLKLMGLFQADPEEFDIVFVANATAGIKLVAECLHGRAGGFNYSYHIDSHTSLVGARELAEECECLDSDQAVERGIAARDGFWVAADRLHLFGFPAQSNMNGRRLPFDWCTQIRSLGETRRSQTYTLLDAAAFVSTTPLDFSDAANAPDFTVLSLYKIFGFPDLGALIVRKDSSHVLDQRRYFGGGTVDMVVCAQEQWHISKSEHVHDRLEDGTLPIHSILALDVAMENHKNLFGSLQRVSSHALHLARRMFDLLSELRHSNGVSVCEIYADRLSSYDDPSTQGPIVAFNIRNAQRAWVSVAEVEKLAAIRGIEIRTGGLCNPGGTARSLQFAPWEMRRNYSEGQRCGNENDILFGKPTGMIRVSFGAMSTLQDVSAFESFMREFFVDTVAEDSEVEAPGDVLASNNYTVESLTVYPIKSCRGWTITERAWPVRPEGLAWDREWCLVHAGTSTALSQKRYPKMALLQPSIDLQAGKLRIRYLGGDNDLTSLEVDVPLSADPRCFAQNEPIKSREARVCGEVVSMKVHRSESLTSFFTRALGVACQLARFPPSSSSAASPRFAKAHMQPHQLQPTMPIPGAFPTTPSAMPPSNQPMLLANESPILVISRSSLNRLNEDIKARGGKAVQADVFRANIVISDDFKSVPGAEQPYLEDTWRYLKIGSQFFQLLGSCRRCQMVCIDQHTAEKNEEPFVTLARTRRFGGKVYFGQHACHVAMTPTLSPSTQHPTVSVGDNVHPCFAEDVQHVGQLSANAAEIR